jgi:cob(I)alamin adenosyltransferase
MELLDQNDSDRLCEEMDAWNEELQPLESFILPTGTGPVAAMHLARTVTRRLERAMVGIKDEMRPLTLQYVNRLSDWLFILTRWVSFRLGEDESLWVPKGKRGSGTAELTRRQNANR